MNIWEKIKKCFKEKKETLTLKEVLTSIVLLILGLFILGAIWFVFFLLGLAFDNLQELEKMKEMRDTNKEKLVEWASVVAGGVIAVIGLFALIWRSILMERQIKDSQEQTKISQKQMKIAQKSQYTEQFLKSVEQTASSKLEICLGGLASLGALSRENKKEYRRVWKYLGEFLRYHKLPQNEGEKPHPKVKTIAKMLRERKIEYEDKDFKLDLTEAHLEGANLNGVHLENAQLDGANLSRTHLAYANFGRADLFGTNLKYANLNGAHLEKARLFGTNLQRASLDGASLDGVILLKVNLESVNLSGVNLDGLDLDEAKLERVLFGGIMESGKPQDLTRLTPEQLRGTYYNSKYLPPTLPEGISDADKPKGVSVREWFEKCRGVL